MKRKKILVRFIAVMALAIKYTLEGGSVSMILHELVSEKEGYALN